MPRLYLLCLLFVLAGCQARSPAEALLDDYLIRLSRVLGQDEPIVVRQSPPRLPPARHLQLHVEAPSVDLLDYWAFRKCGLAPILGERNSVLGRVLQPSQRLHMEGRIVRQLALCEGQLEDEEMLQLTRQLSKQKRAQFPLHYWNATVASPELRQFWSPAYSPLDPSHQESYSAAETALEFLANLPLQLGVGPWPPLPELEAHYQQLEAYSLGGRLVRSLQLGSDYMASANRMLELATESAALCPSGLPRRELDYARNVMVKIFAGRVQVWFAALSRTASALLEDYDALIAGQAHPLQAKAADHQKSLHELFDEFRQLNRLHVERWQALFERCDSKAVID